METDKDQETSNSKFKKLTQDELDALPKEEAEKYIDLLLDDAIKTSEKLYEDTKELVRFMNECLDNPTEENLKIIERSLRSAFEQEEE